MQVSISPNDSGAPNFTRGSREYEIDKANFINKPTQNCIRVLKGRRVCITGVDLEQGECYVFKKEYARRCNRILVDPVKKTCKCKGECGCVTKKSKDDLKLDCKVRKIWLGGLDDNGQPCDFGDYYIVAKGEFMTNSKIMVKEYSC